MQYKYTIDLQNWSNWFYQMFCINTPPSADQKNPAQLKNPRNVRDITILELRQYASGVASTPTSLSRLCCHHSGCGSGQLSFCAAGGRTAASTVRPFIIPV